MTRFAELPVFDDATLRGHLLAVAETIVATLNSGLNDDGFKRLRECATVTARVAQALGERAPREKVEYYAELQELEQSEARFAVDRNRRAQAGIAPPVAGARQLDQSALEAYLRSHPLGGTDVRLTNVKILAGGRCKLTALVEQAGACALPEVMILRQDWEGGATDTTVGDEYGLLEVLSTRGLLTPRPYLLERSETAVGLPFMLMERMAGGLHAGLFEPPSEPALAAQLAEQLGKLHALPLGAFEQLGISAPPENLPGLLEMVEAFEHIHRTIGIGSAIIDAGLEWLRDHVARFGQARSLIHNDLGFHNALTDGDRLTAILDWELAAVGHPAADLGYVKHFVVKMVPWDDFLDVYRSNGGWIGDEAELQYHTIWNAVRLYSLIMRARAAIAAGHIRDIEIAHACADNLILLLLHLGKELALANFAGADNVDQAISSLRTD